MLQTILYSTIGIYFAYYVLGVIVTAMRSNKRLHSILGKWLPRVTIIEILIIESCVQLSEHKRVFDDEFKIHIWLALATLAAIVLQWWFDGKKSRAFHIRFHFVVTVLFTITTITGLLLVKRI